MQIVPAMSGTHIVHLMSGEALCLIVCAVDWHSAAPFGLASCQPLTLAVEAVEKVLTVPFY